MPESQETVKMTAVPQGAAVVNQSVAQTETTVPEDETLVKRPRTVEAEYAPIRWWLPLLLSVVFFFVGLFTTESNIKSLTLVLIPVTIVCCFARLTVFGSRITVPMLAVGAWVLVNGISMFYGISGKFALREFLKIEVAFCGFLLIVACSRRGEGKGRVAASMLEGATALASFISIDMLSTHLFSVPLERFLDWFSTEYLYAFNMAVEPGVRMNSLYENPNVFAGVAGLAVILGLETSITSSKKSERLFHLVCLYLNALAFLLVFSMGASAFAAVAFVVFLLLERRERKASLLLLMVETFALVVMAVIPIYLTSFDIWDGIQPVPMLCAVGGAALLCALDNFVGRPLGVRLSGKRGVHVAIVAVLVLGVAFGVVALNTTTGANLAAGASLRRAAYPAPGTYTMELNATAPVQVTIQSQNRAETMMHTSTTLYSGAAQGASFTVPEDSEVVYFKFIAAEDVAVESATYRGSAGQGSLPLKYVFLPGFVANRLQGLFANENAIQRTVFFDDGMKLFAESPVFGRGLSAFESAYRHVQSFYYVTRYVHNHYIETLVSTGVVGLVFFVGMLAVCAFVLWKNLRREDANPLAPALAAALLFMAGHAAVEVVFSFRFYLPIALGVLALICVCCGEELPLLVDKEEAHGWVTVGLSILLLAFGVTVYLNMRAANIAKRNTYGDPYKSFEVAAKIDLYEWVDFELSYVYFAKGINQERAEATWAVFQQANQYAEHLSKQTSNFIPTYLAEYYFSTDQQDKAFAMLEKYVAYLAADSEAWNDAFGVLLAYSEDTPEYRAEVAKLYQQLLDWNERNMGTLTINESNQAYIDDVLAKMP